MSRRQLTDTLTYVFKTVAAAFPPGHMASEATGPGLQTKHRPLLMEWALNQIRSQ